jgi:chromosome segregation ATPase
MSYTKEQIEMIIEENNNLKKQNETLKLVISDYMNQEDDHNEEIEDFKKSIDDLEELLKDEKQKYKDLIKIHYEDYEKLEKRQNKIKTLKEDIKKLKLVNVELKNEINDFETKDKQFKQQFKEDMKEDIKAIATINYLDNQYYNVKKNNDYLKLLLSKEKKEKIFYNKICKNFFIDKLNEVVSNNDLYDFEDDQQTFKKFELDSEYLDLDDITKENSKLLFKMLNEVNKTMQTEYLEDTSIEYMNENEFMIYNELWTM